MKTWPGNNRNGAVAIWQGLSKHVAREPAQITGVERPFFRHHLACHIHQRPLQVLREFLPHGGVMDVRVTVRHLRPKMAEVALNKVVGNAEVDHSCSDGVAKLMGLEAEEFAVGVADLMVVGQAVDSLREALLLAHPALRTRNSKVVDRPVARTTCCCSCTTRAISCETGIVCSLFILPCMNRR